MEEWGPYFICNSILIKLMEVNVPDKGVFKGMGRLETNPFINKKNFPRIRNLHQFDYTHSHQNDYKTSFQTFKPYENRFYKYDRVKKNRNESQFDLGKDKNASYLSEAKGYFIRHDKSVPPKPFKEVQEGIGINQYEQRTGQKIVYSSTAKDSFNPNKKMPENINYKYTRSDRFNPITGQIKNNTSFGFQDFTPKNNKGYRANNFTVIPSRGQKYDIISGRKLTFE